MNYEKFRTMGIQHEIQVAYDCQVRVRESALKGKVTANKMELKNLVWERRENSLKIHSQ